MWTLRVSTERADVDRFGMNRKQINLVRYVARNGSPTRFTGLVGSQVMKSTVPLQLWQHHFGSVDFGYLGNISKMSCNPSDVIDYWLGRSPEKQDRLLNNLIWRSPDFLHLKITRRSPDFSWFLPRRHTSQNFNRFGRHLGSSFSWLLIGFEPQRWKLQIKFLASG